MAQFLSRRNRPESKPRQSRCRPPRRHPAVNRKDRSADGTSENLGRAGRIMRNNSRRCLKDAAAVIGLDELAPVGRRPLGRIPTFEICPGPTPSIRFPESDSLPASFGAVGFGPGFQFRPAGRWAYPSTRPVWLTPWLDQRCGQAQGQKTQHPGLIKKRGGRQATARPLIGTDLRIFEDSGPLDEARDPKPLVLKGG